MTIPQWLELPYPVRSRLKIVFGIPRSAGTEVHNNIVISDGHTHLDLAHITVEAMQDFLKVKEADFHILLNRTIEKIWNEHEAELQANLDKAKEKKLSLASEKIDAFKSYTKELNDFAEDLGIKVESESPKRRGRPKKV